MHCSDLQIREGEGEGEREREREEKRERGGGREMSAVLVKFVSHTPECGTLDHADMSVVRSLHCPLAEKPG